MVRAPWDVRDGGSLDGWRAMSFMCFCWSGGMRARRCVAVELPRPPAAGKMAMGSIVGYQVDG